MGEHRIEATTLGDLLLRAADRWPDNDAVVFPEARATFAQLVERSYARARSLIALGVRPGEHVGTLMPNSMEHLELIFAASFIGALPVPINARFKAAELGYVIENADLAVLLTTDVIAEHTDFTAPLYEAFPDLEGAGDPASLSLKGAPKLRSAVMMGPSTPKGFMPQIDFDALASQASDEDVDARRVRIRLSDPCVMMYTSGTTANPKGCPVSHEGMLRNGINLNRERFFFTPQDRVWDPLPFFHMASILPMIGFFDGGAALLTMTHFDAGRALEMMEKERTTIFWPAFHTVAADIINHADFAARDLSHVHRINCVGPPDVLRQYQDAFPQAVLTSAYGLTECSGVVAFGCSDDSLEERLHACGRPFSGLEAKIIDPDTGVELPTGEQGELLIRGYGVFGGYYKDVEKTAQTLRDGWLHTGDLCSLDAESQIRYHGRIKDMLKIGGENVACVEIESFLATHPAVKLAQVIAMPDPRLEEVAAAFIELKEGESLCEQDMIEFCTGQIASFKVPRYIRFVREWPMSSSKIQKFKLKKTLSEEIAE